MGWGIAPPSQRGTAHRHARRLLERAALRAAGAAGIDIQIMAESSRAERRDLQEGQRQAKALAALSERACEIVLVRHGETQWNVEQRLQGQLVPGPGLTERGRQQAQVLAQRLRSERFDCIYSSDLLRATQTAAAVAAARRNSSGQQSSGQPISGQPSSGGGREPAAPRSGDNQQPGSSGSVTENGADDVAGEWAEVAALGLVRQEAQLRERKLGVLQGLTRAEAAQQHPDVYESLSAFDGDEVQDGFPESICALEARAEAVLQALAARHPGQRLLVVTHGGFLQAAYMRAAGHPNWGKNVNASINTIRIDALGPAGGSGPLGQQENEQQLGQQQQGQQQQQQLGQQQQQARPRRRCQWAVVRWGDAEHLEGVGALASAFGGGTEG